MRKLGRKPGKEHPGRRYVETKRLIAGWRSNWARAELAAFFRVHSNTIVRWAQKYGLKYKKRGEQTALDSYAVRPSSEGGPQITLPRYIVKKQGLKVGDKIRFKLKEDKCFLRKETNNKTLTGRPPSAPPPPRKNERTNKFSPAPKKSLRRQRLKIAKEHLLVKWRSDLTADSLAALFGVSRFTIAYWARKYDLDYDYWRKLKRESFRLRQTGLRGYEITLPRLVVNKLGLKTGDRMRFVLKKGTCFLTKEK